MSVEEQLMERNFDLSKAGSWEKSFNHAHHGRCKVTALRVQENDTICWIFRLSLYQYGIEVQAGVVETLLIAQGVDQTLASLWLGSLTIKTGIW